MWQSAGVLSMPTARQCPLVGEKCRKSHTQSPAARLNFSLGSPINLPRPHFFSNLPQFKLIYIHLPAPKEIPAARQVFHVRSKSLLSRDLHSLLLVPRKIRRPAVQRPRIMRPETLAVHQLKISRSARLHHRLRRG